MTFVRIENVHTGKCTYKSSSLQIVCIRVVNSIEIIQNDGSSIYKCFFWKYLFALQKSPSSPLVLLAAFNFLHKPPAINALLILTSIFPVFAHLISISPTFFLQQSLFEAVIVFFSSTTAFARRIHTDVCVFLFQVSNGTLAIGETAMQSGTGVTDCSAPRRTLHGHGLPCPSAANLVVIRSVKVQKDFLSLSYSNLFFVARKVKWSQHLTTRVCLGTTRGTPRRCFCKVPSPFPSKKCSRLPMSEERSLRCQ